MFKLISKLFHRSTVRVSKERLRELEYRSHLLDTTVDFLYSDFTDGELRVNLDVFLAKFRKSSNQ